MLANKHSRSTVTAVKGHLVNKSSPLATDSCKLEKQFITAQNMASHYKRVTSAKSSIDTSPPKSMLTSQKARDRAKREMMRYSMAGKALDRAKSADTARQSISEEKSESKSYNTGSQARSIKSARGEEIKPRVLPDQQKLNKSMSNMFANFTKHSANRIMLYKPTESENGDLNKSQFVNPLASSHSLTSREHNAKNVLSTLIFNAQANESKMGSISHPALKAMSRLVNGHNYDVLENHAHKFKQPDKSFQPRIINEDKSSSKLKASSCYQPPRRTRKANGMQSSVDLRESVIESTRIEEEEVYEPKRTLNQSSRMNRSTISVQNDHEDVDDDDDDDFGTQRPIKQNLNNSHLNTSASSRRIESSQTSLKRAAEKEEELKYLEFVKEVTDDIISRGITSNRVINNCFNFHIKKNKDILNESKMRDLLENLREDIGIPNENEDEIGTNYYQTINKAILLDKEKNKENLNSDDLEAGTEYLTLRKFGWSNPNKAESVTSLNTSVNRNLAKTSDQNINQNAKAQISENNNLFGEYENQIIKNIQSIRRKSIEKDENEKYLIEKNSRKSSNESLKSVKGSILKKTKSHSSELSRKNSNDSDTNQFNNQTNQNSSKRNDINNNNDDSEEDDDDLYIGSQKWQKSDLNTSKNSNQNSKVNDSKATFLGKNNLNKSEYTDDILFNDNYGEPEADGSNKHSVYSDNDDDEDDGNFDRLMQTKSFNKSQDRKSSLDSDKSDSFKKSERSLETPTPRPRRLVGQSREDDDTEDEDEF